MDTKTGDNLFIRDPLAWAEDCRAQAINTVEQEAQDAFRQLAEEFEAAASEIDGLVSGYEALVRRKLRTPLGEAMRATQPAAQARH